MAKDEKELVVVDTRDDSQEDGQKEILGVGPLDATRTKILLLLDELESASPFESSSLAEQVRQQASTLAAQRIA